MCLAPPGDAGRPKLLAKLTGDGWEIFEGALVALDPQTSANIAQARIDAAIPPLLKHLFII
jgi:hypothetical protein